MASLGKLGTRREPVDLDFDWFGHTIRVAPVASDLVEIEFMQRASQIDMDGVDLQGDISPEAVAVMTQAARTATDAALGSIKRLIHADDWDLFWSTAVANGQNLQDLLEVQQVITRAVAEAATGFPTRQSSGSPPGLTPTSTNSAAGSPSPETPALAPGVVRELHRLEQLQRPDLAVAVLRATEARTASA